MIYELVDITSITILSKLAEYDELSIRELKEILGLETKELVKRLKNMERKGLVEKKAYIYNDIIFGVTDKGLDELYKYYVLLRDLVSELDEILCSQFEC